MAVRKVNTNPRARKAERVVRTRLDRRGKISLEEIRDVRRGTRTQKSRKQSTPSGVRQPAKTVTVPPPGSKGVSGKQRRSGERLYQKATATPGARKKSGAASSRTAPAKNISNRRPDRVKKKSTAGRKAR